VTTTKEPISLDRKRSLAQQKEVELRHQRHEVSGNNAKRRQKDSEIQQAIIASPAESWDAAAKKAEYVMLLLARRTGASDPQLNQLMTAVLKDFARLSQSSAS
jgi:hypothetical protein